MIYLHVYIRRLRIHVKVARSLRASVVTKAVASETEAKTEAAGSETEAKTEAEGSETEAEAQGSWLIF